MKKGDIVIVKDNLEEELIKLTLLSRMWCKNGW